MRILIDTDAFCKLAIGNVLEDSLAIFDTNLSSCGRLPALPYMLRRGRLRTRYGPDRCDDLLSIVWNMPVVESLSTSYLDPLVATSDIDPGEAQLLAKMVDSDLCLITGDKRALRELKNVPGMSDALLGRIVVFEALLIELCEYLGPEEVRQRIQWDLGGLDNVVAICFSEVNQDPVACLSSYFRELAHDVEPLILWHPSPDTSA